MDQRIFLPHPVVAAAADLFFHGSAIFHSTYDNNFRIKNVYYLVKSIKILMLRLMMVYTIVRPKSTVFLTVLITIAAALASSPEVGSFMNIIEGLATSLTAIVNLFHCSVERSFTPGSPTSPPLSSPLL